MPEFPPANLKAELATAYLASGMKVVSWGLATTLIFRHDGAAAFGLFALIRGTLSFLNYTTLGIAPAIVHHLSQKTQISTTTPIEVAEPPIAADGPIVLAYRPAVVEGENTDPNFPAKQVRFSALLLAILVGIVSTFLASIYAILLSRQQPADVGYTYWQFSSSPYDVLTVASCIGIGVSLRLASDVFGAVLQAFGYILRDNIVLLLGELAWIGLLLFLFSRGIYGIDNVSLAFFVASGALVAMRVALVVISLGLLRPRPEYFSMPVMRSLLSFGLLVSLAQLADYLYAPTDFLLIKHLIDLPTVAVYAPAVQLDTAMLMLVGGLSAVLLPRTAIAHAAGRTEDVRRYFVRGTLLSFVMLFAVAILIWLASAQIFYHWLGDPMLATQAILPLILIHTVVGGSSGVGRSILLGMGRVKPFTIAVLVAGASNVLLSYAFVRFGHLGLRGIVLGTIIAVVGRCAVWQPWYVWSVLRKTDPRSP